MDVRRLALVAVVALLLFPATGRAALPGLNGKLAFSSDRSGKHAIWTADPDGSAVTKIIDRSLADDREPAWGPDGSTLAFVSPDGNQDLFVALANGSAIRDLFPLTGEIAERHEPSWSPDGSRIAFVDNTSGAIHIVDADGTDDHAVVEGLDPSWSPDGSKIAFHHTGAPDDLDIWTVNLGDGALTDVTNRPGLDYQPDWSPDGTKIAFEGAPAGGGATRIYVVDADGSNLTPIGPNLDSPELRPAWSPDGSQIAFASRMDGDFDIYTMRADGTDVNQVTNDPGRDVEPAWQPLPAAVSGFYARPKGATPLRVPLVPAFRPCTSPNRTHGLPLAYGSCSPPVPDSSYLTLGTPDANGAVANGIGFVRLDTVVGAPGPPDDADLKVAAQATDVRCRVAGTTTCGAANSPAGADYVGELQILLPLRITDKQNVAPYPLGPWPATVTDLAFSLPMPCAETSTTTAGADCTVTTTTDTLVPGAVREGARAVWGLGQVKVNDGGADGDADTADDNQLFEVQGLFVP